MRRAALLLTAIAAASTLGAVPATLPQPARLQVVEKEYFLTLSRLRVPSGKLILQVVNFGMDNHDLVVQSKAGKTWKFAVLAPEAARDEDDHAGTGQVHALLLAPGPPRPRDGRDADRHRLADASRPTGRRIEADGRFAAVVTPEEIARITIFAQLSEAERERLARSVADIGLVAGEYAAHEGGERALFGLLEGRIEAVKTTDGIETVVGVRQPGDVFGEVPITLGTVFPVGFRAAEASRVMRLSPHDYYTVAAAAPGVAIEVGKLAGNRIGGPGGLSGLAAAPPPPRAVVVGQRWDSACAELRHFLDRNQISFKWITPDEPELVAYWDGPFPPEQDWPAIQCVGRRDGRPARASARRRSARAHHRAGARPSTTP